MPERKGMDKPIWLVVAIIVALTFAFAYWTSASGLMQNAFDSAFNLASGHGGGSP